MKAVGIKLLKARLSEYVRRVAAGETILVTDRDEVVAEIHPARRQTRAQAKTAREILDALADSGEVTIARLSKKGWRWKARGLGLPQGSARTLLDEIRADRVP